MTTTEERLQILKMIENGRISAEEGARLLEALEKSMPKEGSDQGSTPRRWFRVRVTDMRTGKRKAVVNIPLGLVDVGLKLGARFGTSNVDMNEIIAAVKSDLEAIERFTGKEFQL